MFAFPKDEFARIDILPEFGIAEAGEEAEYSDIVHLASETLGFPFAVLTIIDATDLTMIAAAGLEPFTIPRANAFCSHTILSDDLLVVPDMTKDDRFSTNPHVVGGGITFYAGAPVISCEGVKLGALCVMDREPGQLTQSHRRILRRLARVVSDRLQSRRERLRVQAETRYQLQETEELSRTTLDLAKLVPWKTDARGRLISVGSNWSALTGSTDTAMLRFSWINFVHPDDVEQFCAAWRVAVSEGAAFETEMRLQTVSGTPIWCRLRATPARDESGRIVGWYGLISNIEADRRKEAQLRTMEAQLGHLSRLSAMETMASTLAHELNQPLAAITQYVCGCRRLLARLDDPATAPIVHALEQVEAGALRAGSIVRSVREFVARGEVQRRREPIASIICDAVRVAFGDAEGLEIQHRIEVDPEGLLVLADGIQIQQVLINLLRNAIQALRGAPDRMIVVLAHRTSDEECAVIVRDSGPGIPVAVAARLFSPFNSSKSDGMGIGLSISRTIIEAHGGQISAGAMPEGGTAFRFTLPTA